MLSVVIQALNKSVMFLCMLCAPFANCCLIYSGWAFEITQLVQTNYHHLITAVSVIKKLILCEFTLWGRDLVSVVCVRESLYYGGFFNRKYMIILSGHWKLSIIERCPYRDIRLYFRNEKCIACNHNNDQETQKVTQSQTNTTVACSLVSHARWAFSSQHKNISQIFLVFTVFLVSH